MTYENAVKKQGKHGEWAKHLKPPGKKLAAKIVRRLLRKRVRDEQ